MKTSLALLLLPVLLASSAARADQPSDGEAPPTVAAAPTEKAGGAAEDPNIDRAFLLPTAMTQPARSATYNNYELVLHGFTYGITDHVQATLTVVSPIVRDMPFGGMAAVKGHLVVTPRVHLALQGSVGYGQSGSRSSDGETIGGGGFASVCLRADCSSLLSASAVYEVVIPSSGGSGQIIIYGGSVVHAVSAHVKLLGEVTSLAVTGSSEVSGFDNMPGALTSYGVRLHNADLAADIGFIKPILKDGDNGAFLLGLPFVSVSYRWM